MPNRCRVCEHRSRPQVELSVARGVSAKQISRRFPPLSEDSIYRHRAHIPADLMRELRRRIELPEAELEALRIEESRGLLENLVAQRAGLWKIARQSEELGDMTHAITAHRAITDNLALTGKLLDLFAATHQTTNNILIASPDWLLMRSALIEALAPYPEARQAVAQVLRKLEAAEPAPMIAEPTESDARASNMKDETDAHSG